MSQRADQAAGLIRDAVQKVITKHLHDPRIRGLITVTRATVSDDLKSATVYISVLPDQHRELTMHGLQAASKHIRHRISEELALRTIPDLLFKPDAAAARQAEVLDALSQVARERESRGETDVPPAPAWGSTPAEPNDEPKDHGSA